MKKKALLFLSTVFITCLLYAGDSTDVKQFHRFYAGVSFTPGVSYRYLKHNHSSSGGIAWPGYEQEQKIVMEERNKNEKPSFGFEVGVKAGVRVKKFLSIETGLNYVQKGYYSKTDHLTFGSQWNGTSYNPLPSQGNNTGINYYAKVTNTYHYISVPFALNFNFGKRRIVGIVNLGVNFDFLFLRTNTYASNIPGFTNQTSASRGNYNIFNLSPFLGIGIDYYLNRFMVLRLMPTAQMQTLKNTDTPIIEYLWSAGINASVLFGFKRMK